MNLDKIGKFILSLRKERNLSQNKLAEMIPITRQAISRWEQGKSLPDSSTMMRLSDIFGVTIDELLSGERIEKNREKGSLQNVILNLIDDYNLKKKRLKTMMILSVVTVITLIGLFFGYYFVSTYNSIKVYKIQGTGTNSYTYNGIMITIKQNSYMRLGEIQVSNDNLSVEKVKLYYFDKDKKEKVIYEDNNTDILITDYLGYNEYFSYDDLKYLIRNLYLEIFYDNQTNEKYKLKLDINFANNKIFNNVDENVTSAVGSMDKNTEIKVINNAVNYLKTKGEKVDDSYVLQFIDEKIKFTFMNSMLVLEVNNGNHKIIWNYYLDQNKSFIYTEYENNLEILKKIVSKDNFDYEENKILYNDFINYINKYLV